MTFCHGPVIHPVNHGKNMSLERRTLSIGLITHKPTMLIWGTQSPENTTLRTIGTQDIELYHAPIIYPVHQGTVGDMEPWEQKVSDRYCQSD